MERQDDYYQEEVVGEGQDFEQENPDAEFEAQEEQPDILEEEGEEEQPIPYSYEDENGEEQEEEESEEEPKKKGRLPGNTRIQQITREKYQALNELQRIQQENEYLKRLALESNLKAQESGNAAMLHYDNSSKLKLEHAKSKKFKAHEEGDIQAEIDADVEIATATTEIQQLNYWKAQQEANERNRQYQYQQQEQYQEQNQGASQPAADPQISHNWLQRNSWFHPSSPDYNPDLAQAARDYSEKVENVYFREGRPDLIMSEHYYNEIDNYIRSIQDQRSQGMGKKQLNMRPVRGGAAPVRNSPSQSSRKKEEHSISREEKEIARAMGVSDKQYLTQKLKNQQESPHYWQNNGIGYGGKGYR